MWFCPIKVSVARLCNIDTIHMICAMKLRKNNQLILLITIYNIYLSSCSVIEITRGATGDLVTFSTCQNCISLDANCVSGGDGHTCCTVCRCFNEQTYYGNKCYRNPSQTPEGI